MPRCGCANGACSCKITGSKGAIVAGFGTAASPLDITLGDLQTVQAAAAGTTVVAVNTRTLQLVPVGTIATHTLTLPATEGPAELVVVSSQIITALTITPNAPDAVAGMPTAMTANGFFRIARLKDFTGGTYTWRRVG